MSSATPRNVTIVVPAYNEEATIKDVLLKLLSLEYVQQIVVVDDASADNTGEIVNGLHDDRIDYIRHEKNAGKTAALKTGFQAVKGEITIIQDADLEYDPDEIIFLMQPIWNNRADVVYGSRFMTRKASRVLYFYHYLANKSLTFLSNMFTNKNMTDVETCYKAFRTFLIKDMPIKSSGFGFEIEVTANVSKTRARIFETPISYYGRTYEEGKKITMKDGIAALWYIFRFNILSGRKVRKYIKATNEHLHSQGTI